MLNILFFNLFLSLFLSTVLIEAFADNSTNQDEGEPILGLFPTEKSTLAESAWDVFRKARKNFTFIDTPDNSMHVPSFLEKKIKKKKRKSPKGTVQKIIKKSRTRRKFFLDALTSTAAPTFHPPGYEAFSRGQSQQTTPQSYLRKKSRHGKLTRYSGYQRGNSQVRADIIKRSRREAERENVFILKDFDEIEFLPKEKGYDTAKVHVKKYW